MRQLNYRLPGRHDLARFAQGSDDYSIGIRKKNGVLAEVFADFCLGFHRFQ